MLSSYIFTERLQLDTAVDAWIDGQDSAEATYSDMNTWAVCEIRDFKKGQDKIYVRDFESLRIKYVGRHSKIYNGSKDLLEIFYNENNFRKSVNNNYLI